MRITLSGGPYDGREVDVKLPHPDSPLELAVLHPDAVSPDRADPHSSVQIGIYSGRSIGGVWTWQGWRS